MTTLAEPRKVAASFLFGIAGTLLLIGLPFMVLAGLAHRLQLMVERGIHDRAGD